MNFYVETIESGQGKSAMALYPTPGLSFFAATAAPVRGSIPPINGRVFFAGGNTLWEINANNTATNRGFIGNDGLPVTMATNGSAGNQLIVYSAGVLYVLNLITNALTAVGGLQGTPSRVVTLSGYAISSLANSNKFQVSNLLDFSTWNALSVQQVETFPENIGSMCVAFGLLWVFGQDGHMQVYYNSGGSAFTPFDIVQQAFAEEGITAPDSLCVLDNAPFWIGGNALGNGIAWRANGYTPMRVSNHAVESSWASYPKISDAVGYAYKDQGHTFWVLRFPSANAGQGATWVYDVATQQWHERGFWSNAGYSAHLSSCHTIGFGQHLVGDWQSGNIYTMSTSIYTDNNQPIRRFRRAPHISSEQAWIYHRELQIDLEVGDGPIIPLLDGAGSPRDPQIMLRWSNDGARTWGNEHWVGAGQVGNYLTRARWLRLGRARDRVYEMAVSDPIPWRIIDAYLDASPGFTRPTERLSKQTAKYA